MKCPRGYLLLLAIDIKVLPVRHAHPGRFVDPMLCHHWMFDKDFDHDLDIEPALKLEFQD